MCVCVCVCMCVCVCVCVFINSLSLSRRKESLKTVLENENKENEKCYFTMLAFFDENALLSLELVGAKAGLEIMESKFVRIPACCSFETELIDGTVRSFLDPTGPGFFDALSEDAPTKSTDVTHCCTSERCAACCAGRCRT